MAQITEDYGKFEELQIKYDRLETYSKLVELALDTTQTLNKALREDNEALRRRFNNAIELE